MNSLEGALCDRIFSRAGDRAPDRHGDNTSATATTGRDAGDAPREPRQDRLLDPIGGVVLLPYDLCCRVPLAFGQHSDVLLLRRRSLDRSRTVLHRPAGVVREPVVV